jgi:ABC-type Fe3+/spermidine/putrescine transport system ATPase subunit
MEQVGTPFEIYNFPATAFVASFVGTLNAVEARIADAGDRRLTLAGSQITTASDVSGSAGELVTVAIRPEMITFDAQALATDTTGSQRPSMMCVLGRRGARPHQTWRRNVDLGRHVQQPAPCGPGSRRARSC